MGAILRLSANDTVRSVCVCNSWFYDINFNFFYNVFDLDLFSYVRLS